MTLLPLVAEPSIRDAFSGLPLRAKLPPEFQVVERYIFDLLEQFFANTFGLPSTY